MISADRISENHIPSTASETGKIEVPNTDGKSIVPSPSTSIQNTNDLTTERPPNTKKRKVEIQPLYDQKKASAGHIAGDSTAIPVTIAEQEEEEEGWIVPLTLSVLHGFIQNPLCILNTPVACIRLLRKSIRDKSLEQQNELLTSLLDAVKAQKDNPTYCESYKYPNLNEYLKHKVKLDETCLSKTKYDQLVFLITTQIDAIKEEQKLIQEMQLHEAFNEFNFDSLWRLAIDRKQHKQGKYIYENEAGYLKGYFAGLKFVLEQVRTKTFTPNWETLRDLHQIMTDKVEDSLQIPIQARIKGDKDVSSCLIRPTVDYVLQFEQDGIVYQSISHPQIKIRELKYYQLSLGPNTYIMSCSSIERDKTLEKDIENAKQLFDEYSEKLKNAKTDEEKELAMIFYVTRLERMHLFWDGNLRAIQVLWRGMRLANEFESMVMNNPNNLDDHSDQQLLERVNNGILNFKSLLKKDSSKYQAWDDTRHIQYERKRQIRFREVLDAAAILGLS